MKWINPAKKSLGFKLRENVARILLFFDLRYNFIDSRYLRTIMKIPAELSAREYWALYLFWQGIYPDLKFAETDYRFLRDYNFFSQLGFRLFKKTISILKSLNKLFRHKKSDLTYSSEKSIHFDYL